MKILRILFIKWDKRERVLSDVTKPWLPLSFWISVWVKFWSRARQRVMKNKIEFYFRPIYQFFWRTTFAFEYVIFILNLQIALKLKRKLFFKNSLKIGSQNYLFRCYLIFVLTCNFVSRRHLLLLHTEKTHDTKCNDRFCPQSHAITEKAFEHL